MIVETLVMNSELFQQLLNRAARALPAPVGSPFGQALKTAIEKLGMQSVSEELAEATLSVRILVLEFATLYGTWPEHDRNVLLNDLKVANEAARKQFDIELQARAALSLLRLGSRLEAELLCEALADRKRTLSLPAMNAMIDGLKTWQSPKAATWVERLRALMDQR